MVRKCAIRFRKVYSCRAGGRFACGATGRPTHLLWAMTSSWNFTARMNATHRRAQKRRAISPPVNLSSKPHCCRQSGPSFPHRYIASPETSTGFIDRFLVTAEAYGVPTTLVFNKCDLFGGQSDAKARRVSKRCTSCQATPPTSTSAETGEAGRIEGSPCFCGHQPAFRAQRRGQKHVDQPVIARP